MTNLDVPKNKFNLFKFFNEVKSEAYLVTWPSKPTTIRLTTTVIFVTLIVGVYLGALDYLLTLIMGKII